MATLRAFAWGAALVLVASALALGQEDKLAPAEKYATLTTTALRYVRDLPKVVGGETKIIVLHGSSRKSKVLATDHHNAFRDRVKIKDVLGKVRVTEVIKASYPGKEDFRKLLKESGARFVVIGIGLSDAIKDILAEAKAQKVLTLGCRAAYARAGVGFVVSVVDRRLRMFVHQEACKKAGFRFSGAILKRATIVDRKKE